MSKFLVEPHASMAMGNVCSGCGTHKHADGFVNTNIDHATTINGPLEVLTGGRVYLCAGCVREMATSVGCLQPDQVAVLHGQLDELAQSAERLMAEVEHERDNKFLRVAEVFDYFEERERRRPNEPVPTTKKAS